MNGSTIDSRMAKKGNQVCGGGGIMSSLQHQGWKGFCGTSAVQVLNRPLHRWPEARTRVGAGERRSSGDQERTCDCPGGQIEEEEPRKETVQG